MEKYVYAAHGQQAPPTPATALTMQEVAPASIASVPPRTYPGQMQQQVVPLPPAPIPPIYTSASINSHTPIPAASIHSQNSSTYIPYAREQRLPSTRKHGLAGSGQGSSTSNSSLFNRSQPRTSSSLNPSSVRPQKSPQAYPVSRSKQPLPPYFPISTAQAYMTTYPSRLRLGLTNLMQPVSANGTVVSATAAATAAAFKEKENDARPVYVTASRADSGTNLGKRQRSQVDYRERVDIPEPPSSSSDDEDGDEAQADAINDAEDDTKLSRAARAAKRSGMPLTTTAHASRDSPGPAGQYSTGERERAKSAEKDVGGGGRSWLGQNPPGELVLVQPARRHVLPYVLSQISQSAKEPTEPTFFLTGRPEAEMAVRALDRPLLVPIRIELDGEGFRIRDSFTWNLAGMTS